MIKLLGFMPDVDATTTGALKDCEGIIPSMKGLKSHPSRVSAGLTAVSAEVNSLVALKKLDNSVRTFAGTATTLEEAGSSAWTDRSGATYNCAVDKRWSFDMYGDYALASNGGDPIQVSTTGVFADITGAPQAEYIAVSDGFIMAVNLSDYSDKWHCSAYLDHTDWTEAVATQCTSGRLIGGGEITGLKKFGSGFIAWKGNATYVARYVGAPIVFEWEEVVGDIGSPTGHSAVDIGDRICFLGNDDFYIFDGANNIPIGEGIREWFFEDINASYTHRTIVNYNPNTGNVTWYYVSNNASDDICDKAVVFNVRRGLWGRFSEGVEACSQYSPAGLSFEDLGSDYSTYDDLPTDISFDSPYWTISVSSSGVVGTDHILYTQTGASGESTFTMNSIGDSEQFSTITKLRPKFITTPITSTLNHYYDNVYGNNFTLSNTYDLIDGCYDFMHSTRWHELKLNFTGNTEITSVSINMELDGTE